MRFGPVSLPAGRKHGVAPGPLTLGVRPEHLYIASEAEADFHARVEIVEKLGSESLAYLQTEFSTEPVTIKLAEHPALHPGDEVPVRVARERHPPVRRDGGTVL